MRRLLKFLPLLGACAFLVGAPPVAATPVEDDVVPGQYIVVLKRAVSPMQKLTGTATAPNFVYFKAINGFAASLSDPEAARLRRDPQVEAVIPDRLVRAMPIVGDPLLEPSLSVSLNEEVPTGINRIDAEDSDPGNVRTHIAVLDTGTGPHPALNVVGRYRCLFFGCIEGGDDDNGHGTHVAGIAAGTGFGVSPGLPIYSIKVLNSEGFGSLSSIIGGIEQVLRLKDEVHGQWVINMSLGGPFFQVGQCGRAFGVLLDPMHAAVCSATLAGIVVVVAAGNDDVNVRWQVPAAYDEVITVSAIADYDGKGGHLYAGPDCNGNDPPTSADDTLAHFSNFGSGVDIAAPGVCIRSAWLDGGSATISGTSMASPHVAGAVALLMANFRLVVLPNAEPPRARNVAMRALSTAPQDRDVPFLACSFSETKDDSREPLLHVGEGSCD